MKSIDNKMDALRKKGYCVIKDVSSHEYEEICSRLGNIINETEVKMRSNSNKNVFSEGYVPMHNDFSPKVRYISWYCVNEGKEITPIDIIPVESFLSDLKDSVKKALKNTYLDVPNEEDHPILYNRNGKLKLYYIPWFGFKPRKKMNKKSVRELNEKIKESKRNSRSVALEEGDVLIIEDGSFLHGRDKLEKLSERHLRRFWIR